jgi:hypothetical protein
LAQVEEEAARMKAALDVDVEEDAFGVRLQQDALMPACVGECGNAVWSVLAKETTEILPGYNMVATGVEIKACSGTLVSVQGSSDMFRSSLFCQPLQVLPMLMDARLGRELVLQIYSSEIAPVLLPRGHSLATVVLIPAMSLPLVSVE